MLITVPKLPTIHTPARIPQAEPSQAHEPQTLPSTRSPPHEGGPENLRREPPENEAGVSPHEDASILEPAQQEFLGGLVIAPGGCREAQDEGYAALYYVYMAFLLGLAAYCMVFAGALKGGELPCLLELRRPFCLVRRCLLSCRYDFRFPCRVFYFADRKGSKLLIGSNTKRGARKFQAKKT